MGKAAIVSKRRLISAVAVLALTISTLVYSAESAGACSVAPNAPSVKTVWGPTGAPTFEVTPAATGEVPLNLVYAYSTLDKELNKWGEWTTWEKLSPPASGKSLTISPKVGIGDDYVTFSVVAQNYCGNSQQAISKRALAPSSQWAPKKINIADDLPLSVGQFSLSDLFEYDDYVPFTSTSLTPNICTNDTQSVLLLSAGECRLDTLFNNSAMQSSVANFQVSFNILPKPKVLPTVPEDRPDELSSFQFHVVYVEVKNFESKNYDVSGDINNWLDLANAWMKKKIGKEFIFDTYQGAYDISKLKSQYTTEELIFDKRLGAEQNPLGKLSQEFIKQNTTSLLGKNLLFVIDAPLAKSYCGLANRPGTVALVLTVKEQCWFPEKGYLAVDTKIADVSGAIAHELIHNLGVEHTCTEQTDLMVGEGCEESFVAKTRLEKTLDAANAQYVNSKTAGADILEWKVWRDGSGKRYIPVAGACFVGEPCLVSNGTWTKVAAPLQIQEFINGKWKSIATFKGTKIGNKTSIEAYIVATSKGIHRYREFMPATKSVRAYVGQPILRKVLY